MQTCVTPFPTGIQPPIPTPAEIERFRRLYHEQIGVELDSAEAARTLMELAQFYFLTRGHERYRLMKSQLMKSQGRSPHD